VAAYRELERRYFEAPGSEWADLFDRDDLTNRTDVYRRTVEYVEMSRAIGGKW